MGNLKCEFRQRKAGIFRAGTDPENTFTIRRPIGVEPETGRAECFLCARDAQCLESNVMTFARAVIDGLLEADVLAASKKIEGAERSSRIRIVEYECSDHAPGASQIQSVSDRPTRCRVGGSEL